MEPMCHARVPAAPENSEHPAWLFRQRDGFTGLFHICGH